MAVTSRNYSRKSAKMGYLKTSLFLNSENEFDWTDPGYICWLTLYSRIWGLAQLLMVQPVGHLHTLMEETDIMVKLESLLFLIWVVTGLFLNWRVAIQTLIFFFFFFFFFYGRQGNTFVCCGWCFVAWVRQLILLECWHGDSEFFSSIHWLSCTFRQRVGVLDQHFW